jgi:hypothetical protein
VQDRPSTQRAAGGAPRGTAHEQRSEREELSPAGRHARRTAPRPATWFLARRAVRGRPEERELPERGRMVVWRRRRRPVPGPPSAEGVRAPDRRHARLRRLDGVGAPGGVQRSPLTTSSRCPAPCGDGSGEPGREPPAGARWRSPRCGGVSRRPPRKAAAAE